VSAYRWGKQDLTGLEHAPVIADHSQDQRGDASMLRQALIQDLRRMDGQSSECLPGDR
jgi:hypothetical protein